MKRLIIILFALFVAWEGMAKTKDAIPPKPDPPRLVNDFAGILTSEQIQEKEDLLVAFNDSTSNVICVVTVNDLGKYSAAEFAYEIGERWGVRSTDEKRNGVVLLLKPRNKTAGEVYIAVGYDLEGAIPDAMAKRIIELKMIPSLRDGDYNTAIDSALAYILPLAAGEIKEVRNNEVEFTWESFLGLIILISMVVGFCVGMQKLGDKLGGGHGNGNGSGHYGGGYFPSTRYSSGSWSDYSGGFGGGHSSGGFGDFGGGGGFGGGGAGGRF